MIWLRTAFAAAGVTIVIAAAFSSPASAKDDASDLLQPSSPWNLQYDEDKCRLARDFGGKDGVAVLFDQTGPEPFYTLIVVGDQLRSLSRTAVIRFGDEEVTTRSFVHGKSDDGRRYILLYGTTLAPAVKDDAGTVVPIGAEREAAISTLRIGRSEKRSLFTLNLESMAEPLAALRTCVDDLAGYLAIDPERGETAPTPASNPGEWVTDEDYPNVFVMDDKEGVVSARLTVNAQGRPTACQVVHSSTPQSFDDVVCLAFLQRARFNPATDAQGKPRSAYWTGTVRFQLPR